MPTLEDARAELRRHRPELAIRMAEDIRAEAVASGARIGIAEADAFICTVFCVMQRPTEARSAAERALAEARQIGDDRLQAMAHCALSQLHFVSHETDAMETTARAARSFAERAADSWLIGRADNLLAIAASLRGDEGTALLRYGSALAHFRLGGDEHNSAIVECNIATLQTAQGEPEAAVEHFEAAAVVFQRVGGPLYLAHAGHAEALAQLGRTDAALAAADRAIADAVGPGKPPLAAGQAYLARGIAARSGGQSVEATAALTVAAELAARASDALVGALAATELAALHLHEGRFGESLGALERASRLFEQLGADRARTQTLERIDTVRAQASARIGEWVRATEARIGGATGHAGRVAAYAGRLAAAADLPPEERRWCELGALLHDVGCETLPDAALAIEGAATTTEREVIRLHTVFGERRLRREGFPEVILGIVRHHHERWDGNGYPDGLAGAEIPRSARIVGVAERYDALRSSRGPARPALSEAAALERLRAEAGSSLDPALVELFAAMPIVEVPLTRESPAPERAVPPQPRWPGTPTPRPEAEPAAELAVRVQRAIAPAYAIDGELARGGMSHLFLATDALLKRQVVVKVLPPEHVAAGADRFRREMAIAARLAHPNIVPVLHAAVAGDLHYFVMPYVNGESIRDMLGDGPVEPARALALLRDVAAALDYAHAAGVTHRDLKPENVMVRDGRALLMDFGIARTSVGASWPGRPPEGRERLTALGIAIGTPGYMAPEQLLGDAEPSPRMDVYAFGALAYEMFAGVPPLEAGSTSALMLAHIYEMPRSIRTHCPRLPKRIVQLVDRCLSKAAADRPADGGALVKELAG